MSNDRDRLAAGWLDQAFAGPRPYEICRCARTGLPRRCSIPLDIRPLPRHPPFARLPMVRRRPGPTDDRWRDLWRSEEQIPVISALCYLKTYQDLAEDA